MQVQDIYIYILELQILELFVLLLLALTKSSSLEKARCSGRAFARSALCFCAFSLAAGWVCRRSSPMLHLVGVATVCGCPGVSTAFVCSTSAGKDQSVRGGTKAARSAAWLVMRQLNKQENIPF
ncbi:hypothetical protein SEVIR_6G184450v4 [Setaria viridis]